MLSSSAVWIQELQKALFHITGCNPNLSSTTTEFTNKFSIYTSIPVMLCARLIVRLNYFILSSFINLYSEIHTIENKIKQICT